MRRLSAACVLAITIAGIACGSDDDSSPGTPNPADGGSPSSTDGSSTATDSGGSTTPRDSSAGAQCNDLAQEGTFVTTARKPLPAPIGTGGTIASGKYVLTAASVYTNNDAGGGGAEPGLAGTTLVNGNTFDAITDIQGGSTYRSTTTFTTNGNQLTGTFVCYFPPIDGGLPTGSATQQYSATATELKTYLDFSALGGVLEYVYTKQ